VDTGSPRTQPTPQGAVYLWTIGVFSLTILVLGANLVFLLGVLILGCALIAWFLARRNVRDVRVDRRLPQRTRVGASTPVEWVVENRGRRSVLGIEVEDRVARGARPVRLQLEFPHLAPGEVAAITTQLVFGRRGAVDLADAETWVWSRYPLGVFRAACVVRDDRRLLVRPAEGRVGPRLREALRGRVDQEARRRRTWRGEDVIYGVREYREGDDPRRIHWRTTARRGTLVVSQWRTEQGRECVVMLGRGASPARGHPAFERAVSAVATIWRHCAREGLRARLVLGRGVDTVLSDAGRGLEVGLDELALVGPQAGRRPRLALRQLRDAGAARSVVYVASGREAGLEQDVAAAAGPGGTPLVLRADQRSIGRYLRGLP
jgi:uncharacterized protein (DUF58 family)